MKYGEADWPKLESSGVDLPPWWHHHPETGTVRCRIQGRRSGRTVDLCVSSYAYLMAKRPAEGLECVEQRGLKELEEGEDG